MSLPVVSFPLELPWLAGQRCAYTCAHHRGWGNDQLQAVRALFPTPALPNLSTEKGWARSPFLVNSAQVSFGRTLPLGPSWILPMWILKLKKLVACLCGAAPGPPGHPREHSAPSHKAGKVGCQTELPDSSSEKSGAHCICSPGLLVTMCHSLGAVAADIHARTVWRPEVQGHGVGSMVPSEGGRESVPGLSWLLSGCFTFTRRSPFEHVSVIPPGIRAPVTLD